MKNDLKPCPHCGWERIGVRMRSDEGSRDFETGLPITLRVRYHAFCRKCRARGPEAVGHCAAAGSTLAEQVALPGWAIIPEDLKRKAIDMWNMRTEAKT